ncbi:DUF5336 domain-containing protein [Gordonia sp. ABSL1-1]|uniref:DUF5336 domain-containing protein n=1 Tax=Gordonia sp. ABSL1-1 TaxID=3053923 RepID=UPI002573D253|nr:DUF5336 domain-containing protein [Gordonia sp. ABSL1-1]MDL9937965.1 DUF5336 domain-containing protein [Gordonia sp. ABSL1-1]
MRNRAYVLARPVAAKENNVNPGEPSQSADVSGQNPSTVPSPDLPGTTPVNPGGPTPGGVAGTGEHPTTILGTSTAAPGAHPGQSGFGAQDSGAFAGPPTSGSFAAQPQWGAPAPGFTPIAGVGDPNAYPPNAYAPNPHDPNAQFWGAPPAAAGPKPSPPVLLAAASIVAGIITYFMGFVSWVTVASGVEEEAEDWSQKLADGDTGLPAFFSYEVFLNPGKFIILLGAVALATALALIPKYRKAIPFLAVIAGAAWLALLAAALVLPVVVDLGAGAIVALIFGFLQVALLFGSAAMFGLAPDDEPASASAPVAPTAGQL